MRAKSLVTRGLAPAVLPVKADAVPATTRETASTKARRSPFLALGFRSRVEPQSIRSASLLKTGGPWQGCLGSGGARMRREEPWRQSAGGS